MSELREEIFESEEEELQEVPVFDDASADYLMKRIVEADEQYDRMVAWYKQQIEKAKAIHDRTVAWAERCLRPYLDIVPAKETKTQRKYEFPGGTLILKAQQPKYETVDAELVPWLKQNGLDGMIRVKEEAAWGDLKKVLKLSPDGASMMTEDGEIVPGVTVTQREPEFKAIPNTKNI